MAKLDLESTELVRAIVKVFDKDHILLYEGGDASEWIIENAVHPDHVEVEGVERRFSIDQFMDELDKQDEEYDADFPNHGEISYYREQTEKR